MGVSPGCGVDVASCDRLVELLDAGREVGADGLVAHAALFVLLDTLERGLVVCHEKLSQGSMASGLKESLGFLIGPFGILTARRSESPSSYLLFDLEHRLS